MQAEFLGGFPLESIRVQPKQTLADGSPLASGLCGLLSDGSWGT